MRNKTHPRIKPITAPWSSSHPITERVSVQPSLLSNGKQDDLVNPLRQPINKLHPRVMFLTSQNYQNLESLQTWPPANRFSLAPVINAFSSPSSKLHGRMTAVDVRTSRAYHRLSLQRMCLIIIPRVVFLQVICETYKRDKNNVQRNIIK